MAFKSGFIAILGKPNVGKSTLLNTILEQKVSIVSPKPNLTRRKILGIKHLTEAQLIFVDTPGIQETRLLLNKYLVKRALSSKDDADLLLFLAEAPRGIDEDDMYVLSHLKGTKVCVFLVLNKMDLVKEAPLGDYQGIFPFSETVAVSALTGESIPLFLDKILDYLPEGPRYFPEDMITDEIERDIAAEIIREKLFDLTRDEVPYAVAVLIDEFSPREEQGITFVSATIYVERESQKGIVIGKGGLLLKKVGELARADIESLIGEKVFLQLWVKVAKNWRHDPAALRRFGFV